MTTLFYIPIDVFALVFSYCTLKEKLMFGRVCKSANKVMRSLELWNQDFSNLAPIHIIWNEWTPIPKETLTRYEYVRRVNRNLMFFYELYRSDQHYMSKTAISNMMPFPTNRTHICKRYGYSVRTTKIQRWRELTEVIDHWFPEFRKEIEKDRGMVVMKDVRSVIIRELYYIGFNIYSKIYVGQFGHNTNFSPNFDSHRYIINGTSRMNLFGDLGIYLSKIFGFKITFKDKHYNLTTNTMPSYDEIMEMYLGTGFDDGLGTTFPSEVDLRLIDAERISTLTYYPYQLIAHPQVLLTGPRFSISVHFFELNTSVYLDDYDRDVIFNVNGDSNVKERYEKAIELLLNELVRIKHLSKGCVKL
jgi:hypothetical protein